ncbi:hypothetical protein AN963_02705 [Brevibacillus choshinensis]|uniref:Uncharacterized protein n=1 Tax=Brevibacillus choshinensis TaxID=54911 RepID=A0ABR5NAZ8_BRECH|nr:hypothetical protein AN963_02705 [Brevibacillus choshinensis]
MNEYLLNYYSLTLNFIEEFNTIQYKGIPLAIFLSLFNFCNHEHPMLMEKTFLKDVKHIHFIPFRDLTHLF